MASPPRPLQLTEVPFLFTVLIGVSAWTFTRLVDRITTAPTLSYECHSVRSGTITHRCTVANVSHDRVFRGLLFHIESSVRQTAPPRASWRAPCENPAAPDEAEQASQAQDVYEVRAERLDSGCAMDIDITAGGGGKVMLAVSSDSAEAVRVEHRSLATWMAEHERGLLVALGLFWTLMIVCYWLYWTRRAKRT